MSGDAVAPKMNPLKKRSLAFTDGLMRCARSVSEAYESTSAVDLLEPASERMHSIADLLARAGKVSLAANVRWTALGLEFRVSQLCGNDAVVVSYKYGAGEAI